MGWKHHQTVDTTPPPQKKDPCWYWTVWCPSFNSSLKFQFSKSYKSSTFHIFLNLPYPENNLVHYSVLFNFGHIRRWDQCVIYILYSKISTDPGLLKIRYSHRFVAVVIQILIPFCCISLFQPPKRCLWFLSIEI